MILALLILLLGISFALLYRSRVRAQSKWKLPLPPGPPGLPFVGNILDIPSNYRWLKFTDWRNTYGDIIYLETFGNPTVVLNSSKVAAELLDRRSSNYSDRPEMIMSYRSGWGWSIGFMRYSERWRHLRKMFHQFFRQKAIPIHHRYISRMAMSLVSNFLKTPDNFEDHVRDYAGIIVLHLAYGYETQSDHAEYMALAKDSAESLRLTSLGNFLVDSLPVLEYLPAWLPGAGFKNKARNWAKPVEAIRTKPFDFFKRTMADGTAPHSLARDNFQAMREDLPVEEQEALIMDCASSAYIAGSETTVSLILSWMMVMSNYPDIQARAQDEIQRVIGTSRLPSLDDKGSLPYVEAVILETLRWSAITPLAIPHRTLNDDVYEGYLIPGGATVIGNTWAMLHDEVIYHNPYKFDPERFLGEDKAPDPTAIAAFGFGRRICPGRHLALSSSWIAITLILSTLNLRKAIDADGNETHVPMSFLDGIVSYPNSFKIRITPRSPEAINLIRNQNRGGIEADG